MASPARTHDAVVLIAEDNAINCTVAQALLAARGLHTAVARDGREAVQMARDNAYDAIFMDCNLPVVDGYEATRQIRSASNGRHVPIIAMTALSMPIDRECCLAAGMDDFLSKPIDREQLDCVVQRWLPTASAPPRAEAGAQPQEAAEGDEDQQVLDEATVQLLKEALPPERRRQLVAAFEAQLERGVTEVAGAISRHDPDELRRVADLLKGSSATFGASRLRLCCSELEKSARWSAAALGERQLDQLRASAEEAREALREALL